MTAPIEDVSSLPGKKVTDQEEVPIGEVTGIYAMEGDGHPMWVSVEASTGGMAQKRTVLIPLARIKEEEDGALRVPYSKQHITNTPEVDDSDGISEECERKLRDHYGIDRADQELRSDNKSYATLVPEEEGTAKKVDDPEQVETPDADKRTEETKERLHDPGSNEIRDVDAGEIADESTGGASGSSSSGQSEGKDEDEDDAEDDERGSAKSESSEDSEDSEDSERESGEDEEDE